MRSKAGIVIENKIVKVSAFLFQLVGIFGFSALWSALSKYTKYKSFWLMIGFPVIIIMLSIIWTDSFQEYIAKPRQHEEEHVHNSKQKVAPLLKSLMMIKSSLKLMLFQHDSNQVGIITNH